MARPKPFFPKSHSKPRVDGRRVLSGIIFVNRNGLRWRDAPAAWAVKEPMVAIEVSPLLRAAPAAASMAIGGLEAGRRAASPRSVSGEPRMQAFLSREEGR